MLPTKSLTHWYSTRATGAPKSLTSNTISFRFLRTLAEGRDCCSAVDAFVVGLLLGDSVGFDFSSCFDDTLFVVVLLVVVVAFVVVFVVFVGADVGAAPSINGTP